MSTRPLAEVPSVAPVNFCPYCGTAIRVVDGSYCHQCGKSLPAPEAQAAAETNARSIGAVAIAQGPSISTPPAIKSAPKSLSPWFWLGCVAALGLLASVALPLAAGQRTRNGLFAGIDFALLAGFMNAYLFRRVGRSRWLGFLAGLAVGLAFIWSLSLAIAGARSSGVFQSAKAPEAERWKDFAPKAGAPNPFDQFDPKPGEQLDIQPLPPGFVPFNGKLDPGSEEKYQTPREGNGSKDPLDPLGLFDGSPPATQGGTR